MLASRVPIARDGSKMQKTSIFILTFTKPGVKQYYLVLRKDTVFQPS